MSRSYREIVDMYFKFKEFNREKQIEAQKQLDQIFINIKENVDKKKYDLEGGIYINMLGHKIEELKKEINTGKEDLNQLNYGISSYGA